LIFSRSIADITIVLISILFLYYSHKNIGWGWIKEKWFCFALIFSAYCMIINSALSINPTESLAYSIFFVRWPLFAMALAYWVLNDTKSLKRFFLSMTIVLVFIIFDTWWQFFFDKDIFGFSKMFPQGRLTGPFQGNPQVGVWISKLILLLPLFLILYNKMKFQDFRNNLSYGFFIIFSLLFLTIFITGERMAFLMNISCIFIFLAGLTLDKILSYKKILALSLISFSGILTFALSFPDARRYAINSTIEKILNWRSSDYGLVWQSAYDVWMQSPFFGAGLHKYREACENLGIYGTYLDPTGPGVCFHPHNITLQLLSETGIIGFVLFYLMVIFLAIASLRTYFKKKLWLNFAIVFSIIFSCFLPIQSGTSFFANKYGAIIWLLIGVMLATNRLFNKGNFFNSK
jgi:O-antigen ligase